MSLLRRVSVTAVAALSGRSLGTRLGFGGFLTRGFPKAVGGCWPWENGREAGAGREKRGRFQGDLGGIRREPGQIVGLGLERRDGARAIGGVFLK